MSSPAKPAAPPLQAAPVAQPKLSRMLSGVVKGKVKRPPRIYLYGVEGIGKSTLASDAPKPIFLGAEDGTTELDVPRFPQPRTLADVYDAFRDLQGDHDYETLVIDTVDWIEPLVWKAVTERDEQLDIESYGFGKGYTVALVEWRSLLAALERTLARRPMRVIALGHCIVKTWKNPEGEDFDRYVPQMHEKAAGLWKQWCDALLFANYETYAMKAKRDEKNSTAKAKGFDTGKRLLFTERTAAFDAKNRYGLPRSMPLSWGALQAGIEHRRTPTELLEEVKAALPELSAEEQQTVTAAIGRAGNDPLKISQLHNYVQVQRSRAAAQKDA